MVQESHTPDTVDATHVELAPEQEDILWWEYYQKIIYLEDTNNGTLPV